MGTQRTAENSPVRCPLEIEQEGASRRFRIVLVVRGVRRVLMDWVQVQDSKWVLVRCLRSSRDREGACVLVGCRKEV